MIAPYVNPRPRPALGWLVDQETALDERGRERRLADLLAAGVRVWAEAEQLRELTRQGFGSAVLWRYVAIGWSPDRDAASWPVRALALPVPDDPHETMRGLKRWRDWLCSYGAAPAGSLGGSGLSLVKATIREPLWTGVGELPPIRYTIGGRQIDAGVRPATFEGRIVHCDIQAAYAQRLGHVRYGGSWARLPWAPWVARLAERNPDVPVYVRAKVRIPELRPWQGPLPVRLRGAPSPLTVAFWQLAEDAYPVGRELQGVWSWPELVAAEAAGVRIVRTVDVWIHGAGEHVLGGRPFEPWLEAVWKGRELRGFAGMMAKATGNATWGQFAIARGQRVIVTDQGQRRAPLRGGNPSQRAFDLAEWITGSVRADLYRGVIRCGDELVAAHTDGLWTSGEPVPGWRVKIETDALRIVNAQCLSYRDAAGGWQYAVAGQLDPEDYFERIWREPAPVAA